MAQEDGAPGAGLKLLEQPAELARAYYDWWFEPASIYPIVLIRICLGLIMLVGYSIWLPYVDHLWGVDSLGWFQWPERRGYIANQYPRTLIITVLVCSVMFTAGFLTRINGLILILIHVAFKEANYDQTWGWNFMIHSYLFYVVAADGGARYSVDSYLRQRRDPDRPLPTTTLGWPVRMFMIHVCAVYVAASWHRVNSLAWLKGEMVFTALANSLFTRFPYLDLHPLRRLMWIGCWGAWLAELFAPVMLWVKDRRTFFALMLFAMHATLELTATIGMWQYMAMAVLFLFFPPEWSETILNLGRRSVDRVRDAASFGFSAPTHGAVRIE